MKIKTLGMRHIALNVTQLEQCVMFYTEHLGMTIEWQPDKDNVYLTSGHDNLALHRAKEKAAPLENQRLDHLGFILKTPEDVDALYEQFVAANIEIKAKPKTHRDGAHSFYCNDPDGNCVQLIYHPPLAGVS